jgi:predicted metal-dependent phosphoesterase TrpH
VAARPEVTRALLGDEWPAADPYRLLGSLAFDVLALGYDQEPDDATVRQELIRRGKREVRVVRMASYKPEILKSSRLIRRYDLHLHSTYSDGDVSPAVLVQEAARRGLAGISVTDHNGIAGVLEAAAAAQRAGLAFVEGIEVSARWQDLDVHILGYSLAFDRSVLSAGLAPTRAGYETRAREMVRLCQAAGFERASFEAIVRRRSGQADPVFGSYDVARELTEKHGVSVPEARSLVATGGACHVPYGEWALTPPAAADLIRQAGGIAVLAHAGLVEYDAGAGVLDRLLTALAGGVIDGLEVTHPYHEAALTKRLMAWVREQGGLATGGSDWHGPGRYEKTEAAFGTVGITAEQWELLLDKLKR